MKIIAMIPARYAATRFPAKLMQLLGDKTVIRRTYEATVATGLFNDVYVVTDSDIILIKRDRPELWSATAAREDAEAASVQLTVAHRD